MCPLPTFVLTIASFCGALVAAPGEDGPTSSGAAAPAEPERRLGSLARATEDAGPLDWVFEKVRAGSDDWDTEKLNDEVLVVLHELDRALEEEFHASEGLAARFAPGFRWLGPERCQWVVRHEVAHVRVERGEPPAGGVREGAGKAPPETTPHADLQPATPSQVLESFQRSLLGAPRALKSKSKVFQVSRGEGEQRVTRILQEMDGIVPGGDRVQLRGILDAGWLEVDGAWRLQWLRPLALERARARSGLFRDASREAFGRNASYWQQLMPGLETWRHRVDSASGMDIYGHQGIAVGDVDGDGQEDLYLPQPAGLPNLLYRGQGDGSFVDITRGSGVDVLDTTGGALLVELDGDGDLDLVVVTSLEPLLFENLGGGRFRRSAAAGFEPGARAGASSMGAAAVDYDGDGDLDLYIFSYLFWAGAGSKSQSSYPYPYHDANNGAPNFLYRNEGGLRFTDVTRASGLDQNNRRFSLAASWGDYDDDGDPDLYVANDFGRNNLYRNRGDGTFEDVAAEAGVEDTGNGMSVVWEDYDNDGRLDLYVGNMWSSAGNRIVDQAMFSEIGGGLASIYRRMARGNSLFRNLGGGRFEDVSIASGAAFGRWSWSSLFFDHDADGREDLFITNGFVTGEKPDDL